jgi:hypothetical protein
MNAYAVCIPGYRTWHDYYQIDPPETYLPIGVFAAETRGQAKIDALREFCEGPQAAVYDDDFVSLRTRLLARHVRKPRGKYSDNDSIWGLIPRDWPKMKEDA